VVHKLFVYGTLKRGCHNSFYLKNGRFVGEDLTKEKYLMAVWGSIPFVFEDFVEHEFKGYIKGEVYLVDSLTLREIDRLENHPYDYRRKRVKLKRFGEAWLYFYPRFSIKDYEGYLIKPEDGVIEF